MHTPPERIHASSWNPTISLSRKQPAIQPADYPDVPAYVEASGERARLLNLLRRGKNVLVSGPTGSGKTTAIADCARELGFAQVIEFPASDGVRIQDLVGRFHMDGSWHDGPLTRACRIPNTVFVLDEINACDPEVLIALHALLDHRKVLIIPTTGQVVPAAKGFVFVGAYVPGEMAGSDFSPAFRQRFRVVRFAYLSEERESSLLQVRAGLDPALADKLARLAALTRNHATLPPDGVVSTRLLLEAAEELAHGTSFEDVVQHELLASLTDDTSTAAALRKLFALHGLIEAEEEEEEDDDVPEPSSDDWFYDENEDNEDDDNEDDEDEDNEDEDDEDDEDNEDDEDQDEESASDSERSF